MKKIARFGALALLVLSFSSCLKTRADLSEQDQNYTYGKKAADNQAEAQNPAAAAPDTPAAPAPVDEKDELIRALNGRVEVLENQLAALQKEKEAGATQDSQKIALLQEGLTKLEAQVQKLENDAAAAAASKPEDKPLKASDDAAAETGKNGKKLNAFDAAQAHFAKQEWKKAILNFQKYADESPKGKNVAEAKYKIGYSFQELGMKEEAMAFYEEVVANYSKTDAGKKSKARLAKLKK